MTQQELAEEQGINIFCQGCGLMPDCCVCGMKEEDFDKKLGDKPSIPPIINEMSENEKEVLKLLDWEMGKYYRDLEEDLKLKKSELKKIVKRLKDLHLIQVSSLVGEEGGYYGKGFLITSFGGNIKNWLINDNL